MGRWNRSKSLELRDNFKQLLRKNIPAKEIQFNLGITHNTLNALLAEARNDQWDELKEWNPTYEVYESRELHDNIIKQMYKVFKKDVVNSSLFKSEVDDKSVKITLLAPV